MLGIFFGGGTEMRGRHVMPEWCHTFLHSCQSKGNPDFYSCYGFQHIGVICASSAIKSAQCSSFWTLAWIRLSENSIVCMKKKKNIAVLQFIYLYCFWSGLGADSAVCYVLIQYFNVMELWFHGSNKTFTSQSWAISLHLLVYCRGFLVQLGSLAPKDGP